MFNFLPSRPPPTRRGEVVPGDARKGNELETAVSLFMDHGGGSMAVKDIDLINAALVGLQAQDTSGGATGSAAAVAGSGEDEELNLDLDKLPPMFQSGGT